MGEDQTEPSREDLLARLAQAQEAIRKLQRAHDAMFDACTTAQRRSTECLDLARANGRIAKAPPGELHVLGHFSHERRLQDQSHGDLSTLLDVPMGTGEQWEPFLCRIRYAAAQEVEAVGAESWAMALMEECAEVACETDPKRMRAELIQLGALAAKVACILDMRAARPSPPSDVERAKRAPASPESLVGALHDRIHETSGRLISSEPLRRPDRDK